MPAFLRLFVPVFFILVVLAAFVWPSYRAWRRTGINPVVLGNSDNAHDFIGKLFKLTLLACTAVILLYSLWPAGYAYLVPIPWLLHTWIAVGGIVLSLFSLVWIVMAQATMGNSWRIGIDTEHKTELIRTGIYRFSRNPIFVGMRIILLGLFLMLPNALTFAIFLTGDVLIQLQVRLEEEFLFSVHGAAYADYKRSTRRWL